MSHPATIVIVIPLYKDWESFHILLQNIESNLNEQWPTTKVIVVDDFSLEPLPEFLDGYCQNIEVVELVRNMGHQKAIAIGLAHAVITHPNAQNFVIMDADGEDKSEDILRLLKEVKDKRFGLCFAQRSKRTDGDVFKLLYSIYKKVFRLLTGQHISFGNFCCMNAEVAKRLIHVAEIWLHFPSGIIKSKLPYSKISTHRGKRYKGNSKMNFTSLVNHGLSAIAVYSEFVAVRITLLSIILSFISALVILGIIGIKQFTQMAIPGWASFVTLGLIGLITQFFSLGILLSFVILSAKTIRNINPSVVYEDYIFKIHQFICSRT